MRGGAEGQEANGQDESTGWGVAVQVVTTQIHRPAHDKGQDFLCQHGAPSPPPPHSPSQSDAPTVMKNWQPFVLGPLLACTGEQVGWMGTGEIRKRDAQCTAASSPPSHTYGRLAVRTMPLPLLRPTMLSRPGPVCLATKFSSSNREP